MSVLNKFHDFDIENAEIFIWIFKKSTKEKQINFTGRWVQIDNGLRSVIKENLINFRKKISEVHEYGLLTENNEVSVLSVDTIDTLADSLIKESDSPSPSKKIENLKNIKNAKFYVIKLVKGNDVLYAVRKTDSSWNTKKRLNGFDAIFKEMTLGIDDSPRFSFSYDIDFFIINNKILVKNKRNFEIVLNYKNEQIKEFEDLIKDKSFCDLFTDIQPLVEYVGSNKINLRRMCAIKQKKHYKDRNFIINLIKSYSNYGFKIYFDQNKLISPTEETCPHIITALLDHRLLSVFSEKIYDVQDTKEV